ncbi:hypothetical protein BB560_003836, partial [Smittium megazygosporum]
MERVNKYKDRLLFAVPKKGRLYTNCVDLLKKIGMKFSRKPRHDLALVSNLPILLVFLPASDIPMYVAEGNVDMGITGYDFVVETQVEDRVKQVMDLGFGACKLQVAVPKESIYGSGRSSHYPSDNEDEVDTLERKKTALSREKEHVYKQVLRSLAGGRVVTSFPVLTKQYFAGVEFEDLVSLEARNARELREKSKTFAEPSTKILYVSGSVEAA